MVKTKQISVKHFVVYTSTVVYITICLLLTLEEDISKFQSYVDAIRSLKANSETVLLDKFELGSEEYLSALINHKVAADTLVYGLYSNEKGSYLIASVINDRDQRILLKLSVDSNIIQNYSKIQYKRVILTAQIKDILKLPYQKRIYSFDDQLVWENLKYDIMLEGKLDDLLYISPLQS